MTSGQDAEEAAELMATMRAEHVPMKSWYNNPSHIGLHSKYGDFPLFWQDLRGWDGWKEVRREYLRFTEGGGRSLESAQAQATDGIDADGGRKKRSRWADEGDEGAADADGTSASAAALAASSSGPPERKRKSRWGRGRDETPKPSINAAATTQPPPIQDPVMAALGLSSTPSTATLSTTPQSLLPSNLSSSVPEHHRAELNTLQERLRKANSRLTNLEAEAAKIDALPRGHPDRSPSPPPIYGPDGTRKNTRANRWRETYTEERAVCLERIMELVPTMRPPGFLTKRKRSRKIHIPVEDHPTYNFIGLIIGPRGKTQKEMENKTGCKIAIRGKGSVKEGAKGRRNGQPMEGDDEPLHVVITGDDPAAIDAAAEMVTSMLVVIDDEKNIHKQNQLRELALLNGTLKDEEWCITCGEKGHKNYECPKRFALSSKSAATLQIKCAICGDTSHPTRDCRMKPSAAAEEGMANQIKKERELDSDYSAFMAELDGRPVKEEAGEDGGGKESGGTAVSTASVPPRESVLTIIQPARVVKVGEETVEAPVVVPPVASLPAANSILTIIQPARVVKVGEEATTDTTGAAAAVQPIASGITTISSTVPSGVATISSTFPTSSSAAHPIASGVTTISSATLPPAPTTSLPLPPSGEPPASLTSGNGVIKAPDGAMVATGTTLPLPPPPPPPAAVGGQFPPPQMVYPGQQWPGVPPPPPPCAYPNQYQQGGYHQPQYGQQPPQQQQWGAGGYNAANGQGNNGAAWNPNGYYAGAGDSNGAGGFNWWDSSDT